MSKTVVIAEMAGTHDRSRERLFTLAEQCAQAGADALKVQFWSDSAKVAARLNAPELVSLYERVRTPKWWLESLSYLAHAAGLEFLATVDLVEDIPTVAPYVDRFKIASVEAHDEAFIKAHLFPYRKPLVISLGMGARRSQIEPWLGEHPVQFLHCVSGYPTPIEEANLDRIRQHRLAGFSDHTANVLTGAVAVGAGARILEVHVRADDTPPDNPDYPHSLTPEKFRLYVAGVRMAERMLGDGSNKIRPSEQATLRHRVTV